MTFAFDGKISPRVLRHGLVWLIYLVLALLGTIYVFSPKEMYALDESSLLYKALSFFVATKDLAPSFALAAFLPLVPLLLVSSEHEAFNGRHSLPLFAANTTFFALPTICIPWLLFGAFYDILFNRLSDVLSALCFLLIFFGLVFALYKAKHAFAISALSATISFTAPSMMLSLARLFYPAQMANFLEVFQ